VTLAAAIERGVNEHEVGAILRFGVEHAAVRSVVFQPVTHAGRHREFDPLHRRTNADVIELVAAQCSEWLRPADLVPVPCCFPTCRSITYVITDGENAVPIPRLLDVEDYLDYVTNRVLPEVGIRVALERLWSASAFPGTQTSAASLAATVPHLECASCGINLPEAARERGERAFRVVVQDFQDPCTLNVKQLMKCCVEEITPDGRLIPFCAYNSVGYREQVRAQMSGVPVAGIVPNATELRPMLDDSPYGSKIARDGAVARPGRDATNVGRRAVRP
jgi:7,8-dihydro-6-hydroxymethylpterin dimethyltransferase